MKILVFGASGKVGRLLVRELLRRGHDVTAFVHSHELPPADRLTNVHGDIYDRASVEATLPGHDVVISTLGSWGTKEKNVLSTAMEKIVPAAETHGIRHLISLTGDGAQAPGDKITLVKHLTHPILNLVAPKILRDGEDHIAIIAKSSLNWTVLRAPVMTDGNETAYEFSTKSSSLLISRRAVAFALADLAEINSWPRSAPFIRKA
jgi:putative NADH-flavin reductase